MNTNGLAVLAGLFLIVIGISNQVNNNARVIVSIVLTIIGIAAIFMGIMMDKIE